MKSSQTLLLVLVLAFVSSCKNCKEFLPEDVDDYSSLDLLDPECVQVEGGSVFLHGRNLHQVSSVILVNGSDREYIGNIALVHSPESQPNSQATLALPAIDPADVGTYTLEFNWYYSKIPVNEKCDAVVEERTFEHPIEYVDSPDPEIWDGDGECSNSVVPVGEAAKPNPETCSGHYCGGYERTIWGRGLFAEEGEKPTVFWNNTYLSSLRITEMGTSGGRDYIKLIVPEGPEGTWVQFQVLVDYSGCTVESNEGEFFYEQGPCEEEDVPPITDAFDHYPTGSGNKLVEIGDVVDHLADGTNDQQDVVVVEADTKSSIRTFKGDGTGALELHSVSTLTTTTGSPVAFDLGHFDGDGFEDAVLVLTGADELLFVYNEGLGMHVSSGNTQSFSLPAAPSDVAVGDFDGDGDDDVAVACAQYSGSLETLVVFFRNDGPRSMTSEPWSRIRADLDFSSPSKLAVGDLDGTGGTDLVLLAGVSDLTTYLSNTSGSGDPLTLGKSLEGPAANLALDVASRLGQVLLLSYEPLEPAAVVTHFPTPVTDPESSTDWTLDLAAPVVLGTGPLHEDSAILGYVVAHAEGQVEIYKEPGDPRLVEIAEFFSNDLAVGVLDESSPADIVVAGNSSTDEIVVIKNE